MEGLPRGKRNCTRITMANIIAAAMPWTEPQPRCAPTEPLMLAGSLTLA